MPFYKGQCHCGSVKFSFEADSIVKGLRCNCSICKRKGALMSPFALSKEELSYSVEGDALSTYQFGNKIAKHHYCNHCGIYTFHETMRMPGHFRVNLACIDVIDTFVLPFEVFDGASL